MCICFLGLQAHAHGGDWDDDDVAADWDDHEGGDDQSDLEGADVDLVVPGGSPMRPCALANERFDGRPSGQLTYEELCRAHVEACVQVRAGNLRTARRPPLLAHWTSAASRSTAARSFAVPTRGSFPVWVGNVLRSMQRNWGRDLGWICLPAARQANTIWCNSC